ncbi:hypothetical protein AAC387_Pa02g1397 [Persea americana]
MRGCGFKPDETTMVVLLFACAELGNLNVGKWVHSQVIVKGLVVNLQLGIALLNVYSKCGVIDLALQIFRRMRSERNVWTWSAMILGLAQRGLAKEDLNLFQQLKMQNQEIDCMEILSEKKKSPTPARSTAPAAQVVGNAFVVQYYHILHQSPELVYRFYQDSSMLSRPELNGVMTSVTTMQAINEKILSLNYKNFKAEIKTTDAQESYKAQDKGYFVLNDVFRYSNENETPEMNPTLVDGSIENVPSETVPTTPLTPDPELEPSQATDRPVMDPRSPTKEVIDNDKEVCDPSDNKEVLVVEEVEVEQPDIHSSQNEEQPVVEITPSVQEDAPKKSYTSISHLKIFYIVLWCLPGYFGAA